MKTLAVAIMAAVIGIASMGTASAQYQCPYGYYFASDGQCYPSNQPYVQPYVQVPGITFGFGFGHEEHRDHDDHRGFEHHDHDRR